MSAETLARWQFGITTVYHFFFVPLTIALSMIVAIFQTLWVRKGDAKFLRLTKFYGKLLLINFAMGVVTGIVQEFQFGMNWSEYSRFVGDIFGAPLALEALVAFFLESTFLGLWIFGWDRLPKKVHLATIWLVAIGTMVSATFILAANSFMQNPLGARFNPTSGRAELYDFGAVLTNPVFLATFPHTIASAWMLATAFVAAIAGWHLARLHKQAKNTADEAPLATADPSERGTWRWAMKFGAIGLLIAGLLVIVTGDFQGKVMTQVQPMKMAAAEALYEGQTGAPFSIITIGSLDGTKEIWSLTVPNLLSFLATGDLNSHVEGINDLNQRYTREYAGNGALTQHYTELGQTAKQAGKTAELTSGTTQWQPMIPVTYWSFRSMIGLGMLAMLAAIVMLWVLRKDRDPRPTKLWNLMMLVMPLAPLFAISFGWIFTEMGRQPWIVFGVLPTAAAVSPTVTPGEVLFSMILYTALYGAMAVVEVWLMNRYIRYGLPDVATADEGDEDEADQPLSFAY